MAEARLGYSQSLNTELEEAIEEIGGRRLEVIDPWRVLPDILRRLRRQALPPRDDVFEIPEAFFEQPPTSEVAR